MADLEEVYLDDYKGVSIDIYYERAVLMDDLSVQLQRIIVEIFKGVNNPLG